jgi:hypothetical protein
MEYELEITCFKAEFLPQDKHRVPGAKTCKVEGKEGNIRQSHASHPDAKWL